MCSDHTVIPCQFGVHKQCLLICPEKQASPITNYRETSAANEVTFMVPSGKLFLCIWPETFYGRHSSQIYYMVRSWKHWGRSCLTWQAANQLYCLRQLQHDRQGFSCQWRCEGNWKHLKYDSALRLSNGSSDLVKILYHANTIVRCVFGQLCHPPNLDI